MLLHSATADRFSSSVLLFYLQEIAKILLLLSLSLCPGNGGGYVLSEREKKSLFLSSRSLWQFFFFFFFLDLPSLIKQMTFGALVCACQRRVTEAFPVWPTRTVKWNWYYPQCERHRESIRSFMGRQEQKGERQRVREGSSVHFIKRQQTCIKLISLAKHTRQANEWKCVFLVGSFFFFGGGGGAHRFMLFFVVVYLFLFLFVCCLLVVLLGRGEGGLVAGGAEAKCDVGFYFHKQEFLPSSSSSSGACSHNHSGGYHSACVQYQLSLWRFTQPGVSAQDRKASLDQPASTESARQVINYCCIPLQKERTKTVRAAWLHNWTPLNHEGGSFTLHRTGFTGEWTVQQYSKK